MTAGRYLRIIGAGVLGAVLAIILSWSVCYLLSKTGVGFFAGKDTIKSGPEVLARTSGNLYLIQHVKLSGSGILKDASNAVQNIKASILLPLSTWTIIPVLALIIGGSAAASIARSENRWQAILSALVAGIVYALILTAVSVHIKAPIDSVPIPEINGTSVNPPAINYGPEAGSTLLSCLILGVLCTYTGGVFYSKTAKLEGQTGNIYRCGVTTVATALVIGLIFISAIWLYAGKRSSDSTTGTAELVPSAAGAVYAGIYGSSLSANAVSEMSLGGGKTKILDISANLYGKIKEDDQQKTSSKSLSIGIKAALCLLIAFFGFIAGWVAVGKGSIDGSLATSARICITQFLITAFVIFSTRIELISTVKAGEVSSSTNVTAGCDFAASMLIPLIICILSSMLAAHIARSRMPIGFGS